MIKYFLLTTYILVFFTMMVMVGLADDLGKLSYRLGISNAVTYTVAFVLIFILSALFLL